jgi:very-short-patch-repair endonuclease
MKRHIETRDRAKQLRVNLTPPERKLWNAIRASRIGVKFQRQVVLSPFVADFAARAERLVIELDGDTHAGREAYDAVRTRALEERGYRVLRFTNSDVMGNLDGVLRAILIGLGRDPESPLTFEGERVGSGGASNSEDPLSPALPP